MPIVIIALLISLLYTSFNLAIHESFLMARFFELDTSDAADDRSSLVEHRLRVRLEDVTMAAPATGRSDATKSTDHMEQSRTRNIVTEAFQCYP